MIAVIVNIIISSSIAVWSYLAYARPAGAGSDPFLLFLPLLGLLSAVGYAALANAMKMNRQETVILFKKLCWGLGSFDLLFLTPFFVRVHLPSPHDFMLRKIELGFGFAYISCLAFQNYIFFRIVLIKGLFFRLDVKKTKTILWVVGLLAYSLIGTWMGHCNEPTGDEPHYLLMAHSLAFDGDFDLKNNFENKDYLNFYSRELVPQTPIQGPNHYSYHSMGYPILIAIPYRLLGLPGVRLYAYAVSSLFALNLFLLVQGLFHKREVSLWVWLLCLLGPPLVLFSNHAATETSSGVVATWLFRMIVSPGGPALGWLFGAGLGLLCWLHEANLFLAGVLFLVFWLTAQPRREILKTALVWVALVTPLFWLNLTHFGFIVPTHNLGLFMVGNQSLYVVSGADKILSFLSNFPRAILGLFFDQEFGLLIYAPIYVLTGLGLLLLKKTELRSFRKTGFILLAELLFFGAIGEWRGGGGSAPRFLVPLHFLFAVCLGRVLAGPSAKPLSRLVVLLSGWGFVFSFLLVWIPWMRWNKGLGSNWVFTIAERAVRAPLYRFFPSLWAGGDWGLVLALFWLGLAGLLTWRYFPRGAQT